MFQGRTEAPVCQSVTTEPMASYNPALGTAQGLAIRAAKSERMGGALGDDSAKFDRSLSLVSWAYNEELLIEGFLDRAFALLAAVADDYEVVIVDDASTDRTPEILASYAAREPRLRIVTHEVNLNVGMACRRAIASARKDYLFWQTVDWSYDLKNIRIFLALLKHFDVVQGVRPTPIRLLSYIPVIRSIYRVRTRSDNLRKALVSLGNYYLLRVLFGVDFQDFQNITLYPSRLLHAVALSGCSSFVNPECLIRTYAEGASFIEVPITFLPRRAGVANGTKLSAILRSVCDIAVNWLRWGWRFRLAMRGKTNKKQIFRVAEPVYLDEEVIRLTAPLFKEFR
jgi:glycosyltransferase involved in cell wall biosynthesis